MAVGGYIRRVLQAAWKLALVAAVIGGVVYYVRFRPVPVEAFVVKADTVRSEVMGTGTLDARTKITISSKITGRIAELGADQNDTVAAGKLLVTLDDSDLRQQMEMASASLEATKSSLVRAEADIARAQAVLTQAKLDYGRSAELLKQNAAARDEVDKAKEALDVAQAGLASSTAAKAEVEHQVVTAERALKYQQARLADARILCPLDDGLVTYRYCEVGDIVVPGTAIMDVVSLKEMWISAWVDESASRSLAAGQPARVVFRSDPGKSYHGEVVRLARQTDRETREFLVDVRVKDLPANWSVGQRAEVYIQTGVKDGALTVPQRTILWKDGKPGVFVDDGGKARYQQVGLGIAGRDNVEIVSGLTLGQVVVVPAGGAGAMLKEGRAIRR